MEDIAELIARTYSTDTFTAVLALGHLVNGREAYEAEIQAAVIRLRRLGAPWARIGIALGVTAQGAQQRYGHLCD